jgi:hypothetical protein
MAARRSTSSNAGGSAPKSRKAAAPKKATASRRKAAAPELTPSEQRRADLVELRRRVLAALDLAEPGQVPALARELRTIDLELVELVPEEVSRVDDLAARRAARRSGSAGRGRSAVGE